jgi:hypothetical protein
MLASMHLENYRCFDGHSIEFRPMTVVVGRNNAGKSTIAEALRLISLVTERIEGLNFRSPPAWTELAMAHKGVSPALEGTGIDFDTICNNYGEPPAIVTARFKTGEKIKYYLNNHADGHALLFDRDGQLITSKSGTRSSQFPRLFILPQVAPLETREEVLTDDYVRKHISSPLAPRHFRNQLRLLRGSYIEFRKLAEESWPELQIKALDGANGLPGTELFLNVRDRAFVGEIARMGHGLQMWLQIMWFISRTPAYASVVLDEPDVYMHPDLQRRLIRMIRNRFAQSIIATHSVEIMAEVSPSEILIIDRSNETSVFADSEPVVQGLVERLGGVHNIHLARMWTAKKCLLVEGKDVQFLKILYDLLFPNAEVPLDDIPNLSIGGWGGWNYAIGSAMIIKNSVGQNVSVYCVLDSDYYTEDAISSRLDEAKKRRVRLQVWRKKEIENYFLVAPAIARAISARSTKNKEIDSDTVAHKLIELADAHYVETLDEIANQILMSNRHAGLPAANRSARTLIDSAFESTVGKLSIVSGKKMIGQLSMWSQAEYGVSLGVSAIARKMTINEVCEEMDSFLRAFHLGRELPSVAWSRNFTK